MIKGVQHWIALIGLDKMTMNYLDSLNCLRAIYGLLFHHFIITLSIGHFRHEESPAKSNAQVYVSNEVFFPP